MSLIKQILIVFFVSIATLKIADVSFGFFNHNLKVLILQKELLAQLFSESLTQINMPLFVQIIIT